jgi:hypothetical protein
MIIICPNCQKEIRLRQKYFYHAGFSNRGFLYCDKSSSTLKFGSYNPNYQRIVGRKHPWTLSAEEKTKLEIHLAPCKCGGRFRFDAPPLCPFCHESLASLLPDDIHFIEIGEVIDADRDKSVWLIDNPD